MPCSRADSDYVHQLVLYPHLISMHSLQFDMAIVWGVSNHWNGLEQWNGLLYRGKISKILIFAASQIDFVPWKLKPPRFNPCECAYANTWSVYRCGFTYLGYPRKLKMWKCSKWPIHKNFHPQKFHAIQYGMDYGMDYWMDYGVFEIRLKTFFHINTQHCYIAIYSLTCS